MEDVVNAGDANLMASHVFIFLLHTPTSTVRLPLYGTTFPPRAIPEQICSVRAQSPVPDNTATDTLGTAPSLFHRKQSVRSGQCPVLVLAAREPGAAAVCPVADLGAVPLAGHVEESRQC